MGAGFHGGFGNNTQGAKANNAPIKQLKDVRYNREKTEGYLLNLNHPVGGAKAKFMKDVLGYNQSDGKEFHKNVVSSLIGKSPSKAEKTQYGTKLTFNTILKGKNGNSVSANVVSLSKRTTIDSPIKLSLYIPTRKEHYYERVRCCQAKKRI